MTSIQTFNKWIYNSLKCCHEQFKDILMGYSTIFTHLSVFTGLGEYNCIVFKDIQCCQQYVISYEHVLLLCFTILSFVVY